MALPLLKSSHVRRAIRPLVDPVAIALIVPKVALKDPPIPPLVDPNAVPLVVFVVPLVNVAVRIGRPAVPVPRAILPVPLVDPAVRVLHGPVGTTGDGTPVGEILQRCSQDPALIIASVAIGIDNWKMYWHNIIAIVIAIVALIFFFVDAVVTAIVIILILAVVLQVDDGLADESTGMPRAVGAHWWLWGRWFGVSGIRQ